MDMKKCEFWFVVGSQFLYGPEVLETVDKRAAEMAETLNASGNLPCRWCTRPPSRPTPRSPR